MRLLFVMLAVCFFSGCNVVIPSDVKPITSFQLSRYLGTWYEIARLENSFEKGLTKVTANYSLNDDGSVKVINRGWNEKKQKWEESIGKAYFIESSDMAALKVSFFGPFYGGYNVIKLDNEYNVALVVGSNKKYLWVLSRTPTISKQKLDEYLDFAKQKGFDLDKLIVL